MKTSLIVTALAAAGLLASTASAADFTIAPDGKDTNPGTAEKPFATLDRARRAVRERLTADAAANVEVALRGGVYWLTEPVVFGVEDSPRAPGRVTYAAALGETPVLSGALPIRDWRKPGQTPEGLPEGAVPHVRVATLPNGTGEFRVISDRQGFLSRARSPLLKHVVGKHRPNFDRVFLEPGQIPAGWAPKHAELSLMPMIWIHNFLPIQSWDPTTGEMVFAAKFTLDRNLPMLDDGIRKGKHDKEPWKFAIENALEFLDQPGEWVVDPAAGLLYLWPRDGEPDGVQAHLLTELIRVEGKPDHEGSGEQPVRGLVFRGLSFTGTDRPRRPQDFEHHSIMNQWDFWDYGNAALRFRTAENCVVDSCRFEHLGDVAIRADLLARRIRILNSLIVESGGSGILLAGYGLGIKNVNGQNRIHNNILRDIGLITRSSMGIVLWQSEANEVSSNDLERVGYTGIALLGRATWEPGYRKPEWGAERLDYWPWEPGTTRTAEVDAAMAKLPKGTHFLQVPELLHSRNNLVKNNRVFSTCLTAGDGNGIYIAGAGLGNRIEENLLRPPGWEVIRCDDDQHGTTVSRNVILDSGKMVTKGKNHFQNNFLYVRDWATLCNFGPGRLKWERDWKSQEWSNQRVLKNIVLSKGGWIREAIGSDSKEDREKEDLGRATIDENLYWSPSEKGREDFERHLETLRAGGHDKRSVLADPLFVNPEHLDFRFKEGSPAAKLGIEGIDARNWGVTRENPFWSDATAAKEPSR